MEIVYRHIVPAELNPALFISFTRTQIVRDCYRLVNGAWSVRYDPFVDDWSETDYELLVKYLRDTLASDGLLYGAFVNQMLKAFVSVERTLFGSEKQYADLTNLYVSQELRGLGIGRRLFVTAKEYAQTIGAKKLYISAHSAVETQAFYRAMGCVEALEYNKRHVVEEPYDCQMECILSGLF